MNDFELAAEQKDEFNPNTWTSHELFNIGLVSSVFLALLIVTTWQAFAAQGCFLKRLYWGICCLLLWLGIAGLVYFSFFPPPGAVDEAGRMLGEMPAEFGLSFAILGFASCAAIVGVVAMGFARFHQRRRRLP